MSAAGVWACGTSCRHSRVPHSRRRPFHKVAPLPSPASPDGAADPGSLRQGGRELRPYLDRPVATDTNIRYSASNNSRTPTMLKALQSAIEKAPLTAREASRCCRRSGADHRCVASHLCIVSRGTCSDRRRLGRPRCGQRCAGQRNGSVLGATQTVKVAYSRKALNDIGGIFDYIASDNRNMALAVECDIRVACESLSEFPYANVATDLPHVYRMPIPKRVHCFLSRASGEIIRSDHSECPQLAGKKPQSSSWLVIFKEKLRPFFGRSERLSA